jgi:hypothetical protein
MKPKVVLKAIALETPVSVKMEMVKQSIKLFSDRKIQVINPV